MVLLLRHRVLRLHRRLPLLGLRQRHHRPRGCVYAVLACWLSLIDTHQIEFSPSKVIRSHPTPQTKPPTSPPISPKIQTTKQSTTLNKHRGQEGLRADHRRRPSRLHPRPHARHPGPCNLMLFVCARACLNRIGGVCLYHGLYYIYTHPAHQTSRTDTTPRKHHRRTPSACPRCTSSGRSACC